MDGWMGGWMGGWSLGKPLPEAISWLNAPSNATMLATKPHSEAPKLQTIKPLAYKNLLAAETEFLAEAAKALVDVLFVDDCVSE
eukprot:CAMPEP_0171577642 /NCGR_PEP_ID=MMETSP0961-20121227/7358_1 /TAXON_ID=87120 /ORGANISM="Aurantiochytrium limacinum, Strain ATCCMYA-1381" /LENGTH=83 /DNA_ID=CAMNT_0012133755 /DNA_START=1 /DNA_END=253 /DNA_ORIENTATION=-